MKKISRLIMLLLAVAILLTSLAPFGTVFAAKTDEVEAAEIKTIGTQRLYVQRALNSGSDYFTTKSSAARELRETMVARGSSVTIPYKADCDDIGDEREFIVDLMSDLYDRAIAHTGEPDEGDSLKWCLKKASTYAEYYIKSGYCYIRITYDITYYTTATQEAALTKEVNRLVSALELDSNISDYQKIYNIYNYITDNIRYDYDHLGDSSYTLKHTAYAAAINKKAVCQGYALLFYRLALEAGIDTRFIAGTGRDGGHAWNIAELDGEYYLLDCTWDAGWEKYSWFLKSKSDFDSHSDTMGSSFWKDYPLASMSYSERNVVLVPPVATVKADPATGLPVVKWNVVPGAVKYEVYGSTVKAGTYKLMVSTSKTQFTDQEGIIGKPHYYKVRAVGYNDRMGEFSELRGAYCVCAQPVVTPSTVAATGKPTATWKAVPNAVKYEVYSSAVKNGTYNLVETTTNTQHVENDAVLGKPYYFKVYAVDSTGRKSASSALKGAYCVCAQPVTTISTVPSSGKPTLKWDAIPGAAKYEIYRATSKSGKYSLMATGTNPQYINTKADAGKPYYYKVRALDSAGRAGAYSSIKGIYCACAQPVVSIANRESDGKPRLTWKAITGASKYEVYRSASKSGTYTLLKTTEGTSFTNTGAKSGVTYYYKVKAISSAIKNANSAFSAIISNSVNTSASTSGTAATLAKPAISLSLNAASGKPVIKWSKISGAAKYEVYRATSSGGTYSRIATVSEINATDTSAVPGKKYYYKVRAVDSAGKKGSFCSAKYVICDCAAPAVSIALKSNKPRLTWKAVEGTSKYEIYRATSKSGTYSLVKTTEGTSYTNTSAKAGTTYYYKVMSICKATKYGNSAYSTVKYIKSK